MNHNFIRPGGVAADLPDGWHEDISAFLDYLPEQLDEFDVLLTGQPIYRERLQGVGVITPEEAIALGTTGPILRSTGVARDLRKDDPYLRYDEVDLDVLRSEEHTSELQSLMRISYAVFCLKKKTT